MNPFDKTKRNLRMLHHRNNRYKTKKKVKNFIQAKCDQKGSIKLAAYNVNGTSHTKVLELDEWLNENQIQVAF